jgi:ubiquinone biosynthesis protein
VAVKVFRPGVERLIETDLDILLELAALAEKRTDWGEYYGIYSLAQEFADTLRAERNYEQEGQNMERYQQAFAEIEYVRVPKVYWETTTRRVLTMERMQGIKISDLAALDANGFDRKEIARRNIAILLKAVLQDGFFHADPHAGNFMVLPEERIVLMDFGIMGQLDHTERLGLVQMFVGFFREDTDRAVEALSDLGIATKAADKRNLTRDLNRLHMRYYGLELEKLHARSFIEDLLGVAFANRLKMPSNLVLVFKTIIMLEGISLQLDPDLNVFRQVEPYVRDALLELESPIARLKELVAQMGESAEAVMQLPRQIQKMLEEIEAGEGNLSMTMNGLDEPTRRITGAANRLVLALLAVAFVIGPALLIPRFSEIAAMDQGSRLQVWAAILIFAGFGMSVLLTLVLIWSIWRSNR